MNVRIVRGGTPTERLSAAVYSFYARWTDAHRNDANPRMPDYADIQEALDPFIKREMLMQRSKEAKLAVHNRHAERISELERQLAKLKLPKL